MAYSGVDPRFLEKRFICIKPIFKLGERFIKLMHTFMNFGRNQVKNDLVFTNVNGQVTTILAAILVNLHRTKPIFELGCFAMIVFQMYCFYKCSVALPHGAMGWSAVCDCGIS